MKRKYRIIQDWEGITGEDDTDMMTPIFIVQKRRFFRYKTVRKYYTEYSARRYLSEQVADYIINDRP